MFPRKFKHAIHFAPLNSNDKSGKVNPGMQKPALHIKEI